MPKYKKRFEELTGEDLYNIPEVYSAGMAGVDMDGEDFYMLTLCCQDGQGNTAEVVLHLGRIAKARGIVTELAGILEKCHEEMERRKSHCPAGDSGQSFLSGDGNQDRTSAPAAGKGKGNHGRRR